MNEPKVKYKKVDSSVHGEVKEIKLIGEDEDKNKEALANPKILDEFKKIKELKQ